MTLKDHPLIEGLQLNEDGSKIYYKGKSMKTVVGGKTLYVFLPNIGTCSVGSPTKYGRKKLSDIDY